jgi:hypothetical protein
MNCSKQRRFGGFVWVELVLMLAVLVLLFQLFPSLWIGLVRSLDVRNWSRSVWMMLNLGVVLALFSIRFVPGLCSDWRERRMRVAVEHEKRAKQAALKEQRETLERLKAGRARRLY